MSGSTISGTISTTVTLGSAGYASPLTITNTGDINAYNSTNTSNGFGVVSGAVNETLLNEGTITGYGGAGIGGGLLINKGFISGTFAGQGVSVSDATLVNDGTIQASGGFESPSLSGVDANMSYVYNAPGGVIRGGVDVYSSTFVDAGLVTAKYNNIAIYVSGNEGDHVAGTLELLPGAVIDGEVKAFSPEELMLGGSGGVAVRIGAGSSIIGFGTISFAAGAARTLETANAPSYSIAGFATGDLLIVDSFVAVSADLVSGVGIVLHDRYARAETLTISGAFGTGAGDAIGISANGGKTTLSVGPVAGSVTVIDRQVAGPVVLGGDIYAASVTITNAGSVIGAGTDGAVGVTANTIGADLHNYGWVEGGAGGGTIVGGYGVSLGNLDELFNTGSIFGGANDGGGLYLAYGSANNGGLIEGAGGASLGGVGARLNGNATLDNAKAGEVHGGAGARGGAGVSVGPSTTQDRSASTLVNDGHIRGGASGKYKGGAGVLLAGPGNVVNKAGGTIRGGDGVRGGVGVDGRLSPGAGVTNHGLILGGLGTTGVDGAGIYASDNMFILNSGTIAGGGNGKADAIDLRNAELAVLPGAVFIGAVVGAGYARLTLEGSAATPLMGFGTEFQGFNQINFSDAASRSVEGAATAFAGESIQHFGLNDGIILAGFNATSETLLDHDANGYSYTQAKIALSDRANTVSFDVAGKFGPGTENRLKITEANGNTTLSLIDVGYKVPLAVYPLNSLYKAPITLGSAADPVTNFSITSTGTVFPSPAQGANAISGAETGITLLNAGILHGEYASYMSYYTFGSFGDYRIITDLGPAGDGVSLTGASVINTGMIIGGSGPAAGDHGAGIDLTASTAANSGLIKGGMGSNRYKGVTMNPPGTAAPGAAITGGYLANTGTLLGGQGGYFNAYTYTNGGTVMITGEHGGAGLHLLAGGIMENAAHGIILGGKGGAAFGFSGAYPHGSRGGAGGIGAVIDGGTLINAGRVTGGAGSGPDFGSFPSSATGPQGIGALIDSGLLINAGTIAGMEAVSFAGTGTLALEIGATFIGAVLAAAGAGDVLALAGSASAGIGTFDMAGSFSGFDTISFDSGAAWLLGGTVAEFASGQAITGFASGDTIMLDGFTASGGSFAMGTGLLVDSAGGGDITLDITGDHRSGDFHFITTATGTEIVICYLHGTGIATPAGEVSVETLRPGDAVLTRFGGTRRIKWIGHQGYARQFLGNNRDMLPVCITAGALGAGLPARDLFVSPGHSILLGDVLVLARDLVNGVTIIQIWVPDEVHYFSIELATHDCVLAAGVWAETYADCPGLRAKHHNAASFSALYSAAPAPAQPALCAPRPLHGPRLEAALAPVLALAAAETSPGPLRGYLDEISADGGIAGWAQDEANPELPVWLEILYGDVVIGTVLAIEQRNDLRDAGIGTGRCAFRWLPPQGLTWVPRGLMLRHATTHEILPWCDRLRGNMAA